VALQNRMGKPLLGACFADKKGRLPSGCSAACLRGGWIGGARTSHSHQLAMPLMLLQRSRTSTCAVALAMVLAAAHAALPAAHGAGAPPASAADAAVWPHACTAVAAYNQTRCPKSATCCASKFSGSGQGCCPWPGAVCCKNQLTCCPAGSECDDTIPPHWPSWGAVTTCKPTATTGARAAVQGKCVCKPGAPQPMSTTKKNVLVIGDSVSGGYTPAVASLLADVALVQRAPWGGDGGAEETAYGIQCLDYWLRGPSGGPISPDVLFWNFGLHDGPQLFGYPPANVTIPGQEGNMSVYPAQIAQLGQTLKSWAQQSGTKLLFGVTTPMLGDARADQDVSSLNAAAKQAMDRLGIPTVDMHAAIIAKCGTPPQKQCFGINGCFNPHCETALTKLAEGYASAEFIRSVLGMSYFAGGGTATRIPGTPTKGCTALWPPFLLPSSYIQCMHASHASSPGPGAC
jgi:hypothetical protein